jgi:hypothetical protein
MMKRTSIYIFIVTVLLLLSGCGGESKVVMKIETEPTIKGVWKIEEIETVGGPEEGTIIPQGGILIFTDKYYSSVRDTAIEPRPLWDTTSPSAVAMAESLSTFGADSGPYELKGSTVMFRPSVCDMPNIMSGGSVRFDYRLEGDALTLVLKPGRLVIPGIKVNVDYTEERYKLKRLE